jgi:folate-dependent phosphoribosylglycinamide formyltransferase PurN
MKIAITTDSPANPYASTLISALTNLSMKPVCVISTEKSKVDLLKREVRRRGVARTVTKAVGRMNQTTDSHSDSLRYLRKYAEEHDLASWNKPLNRLCSELGINYRCFDKINSKETVATVKKHEIDILINAGGGIFRKRIVNAPKIGILNAHMGILPKFRGMNVLEWSLFYGNRIGVTLHLIDTGIDTGEILLFNEIEIEKTDTIESLRANSLRVSVEIMLEGIQGLANNSITRTAQRLEDGKQYFVMHDRLKRIAEAGILE